MWYFYDLLQIFQDKCSVQTKGLNSPFDWIRGIGKGTFNFNQNNQNNQYESKRSFFIYGILVLLFGMFGFDKFYVGSYGQGLTKLIFNFIPFFFLFGWFWTFYDRYIFLVKPDSIMKDGLDAPMPFSWFFSEPSKVSDQFEVLPIVKEETKDESWFSLSALFAPLLAFIKTIIDTIPWQPLYEALVVPVIRPPVQSALATGTKAYTVGKAGYNLGTKVASEGKEAISTTFNKLEQFSDPTYISELAKQQAEKQSQALSQKLDSTIISNPISQQIQDQVQEKALQAEQQQLQKGGAQSSVAPVLAGSLTALLLAGSLKALSTYIY
jgi:TM2 domain-containing membrane protein YozV